MKAAMNAPVSKTPAAVRIVCVCLKACISNSTNFTVAVRTSCHVAASFTDCNTTGYITWAAAKVVIAVPFTFERTDYMRRAVYFIGQTENYCTF